MKQGQSKFFWATVRKDKRGNLSNPCVWGTRLRHCLPDDDEVIVRVCITIGREANRKPSKREQP